MVRKPKPESSPEPTLPFSDSDPQLASKSSRRTAKTPRRRRAEVALAMETLAVAEMIDDAQETMALAEEIAEVPPEVAMEEPAAIKLAELNDIVETIYEPVPLFVPPIVLRVPEVCLFTQASGLEPANSLVNPSGVKNERMLLAAMATGLVLFAVIFFGGSGRSKKPRLPVEPVKMQDDWETASADSRASTTSLPTPIPAWKEVTPPRMAQASNETLRKPDVSPPPSVAVSEKPSLAQPNKPQPEPPAIKPALPVASANAPRTSPAFTFDELEDVEAPQSSWPRKPDVSASEQDSASLNSAYRTADQRGSVTDTVRRESAATPAPQVRFEGTIEKQPFGTRYDSP